MKTKLYNYTGGTQYHVFDVYGGGKVIEICDESGVSHHCVSTGDAGQALSLLLQGQDGSVVIHDVVVKLDLTPVGSDF